MSKPHNWALHWPGNYCLDCGVDDPGEMCMAGDCKNPYVDQNGYPDVSACPEHGIASGAWECPVPEGQGYTSG